MRLRSGRAVTLAAVLALAAAQSRSTPPIVEQITNDLVDQGANFHRAPVTSQGQILLLDADDTVRLYDGSGPPGSVQTFPGDLVDATVFTLGSGATPGEVIGAWRRGAGYANVSIDGGSVTTILLNPESASISDGCVFMVLQVALEDRTIQHAFQVDPATGSQTPLSTDNNVNVGALRIASSQCRAAWTWTATGDPIELHYWNGTSPTILDTGVSSTPSFAGGVLVYSKPVTGIEQVFAVDTNALSPGPVQVSAETDASKLLTPLTDGRHVVWYRSNADGSDAQLILNGGVEFPTGSLERIHAFELPFQLQRGQLLWKSSATTFRYDDGKRTFTIDPSPATTFTNPWLADGFISFIGLSSDGGTDTELFRITATPPETGQPSAPLVVNAVPGTGEITVTWDRILGASSYNLYLAEEPGVTSANWASLPGGRKVTGATSPHTITGLDSTASYHVVVTALEGAVEGPISREASATLIGTLQWMGATAPPSSYFSAATSPDEFAQAWAGANGSVARSIDGGLNWTEVLSSATTGASRVAALAVDGANVWANMMSQADLWKSPDGGTSWSLALEAEGFGEQQGSIAIDPTNGQNLYAGDFILPGKESGDSLVIRSVNGGTNWSHTPEGEGLGDEIHAYALAIDPAVPTTVFAGGSGTPNLARSRDGTASWEDCSIVGGGQVNSIAIDPRNPNVVYASTRDHGVFKSEDSGTTWSAASNGLTGLAGGEIVTGEGFNSIVIDPLRSEYLHLGAGNGYWYSIDGGANWTAANDGFGTVPWVYALALTPARTLIAATDSGLFVMSVGRRPIVDSATPPSGDAVGGTVVTIAGRGFQPGATVHFGATEATSVTVVDGETITATTPAHAGGPVDVTVSNFDAQSGTLEDGFEYTVGPPSAPTGVVAAATSPTSVLVTWNPVPGAASYRIDRRAAGGEFEQIGTSETSSFSDSPVAAAKAYLYRVVAVNSAGTSPDSGSDLATTVIFSDDPIAEKITIVKASHLGQLRSAVNAVRELAGRSPAAFTDAAVPGLLVKALHVTQLRIALDEGRGDLSLSTGGYTDSSLAGAKVRAAHFQEIRTRVQ